jgi:hypothetical protein
MHTDGSKSEEGVGTGIAIFTHRKTYKTWTQMKKTVQVFTDSRITLAALKTRKNNAHLIEQIRMKVIELENQNWKLDFKRV